jgi:hypothetical protein
MEEIDPLILKRAWMDHERLVGIGESAMNQGLLAEYPFDSRDDDATTPLEHDLFLGIRPSATDCVTKSLSLMWLAVNPQTHPAIF